MPVKTIAEVKPAFPFEAYSHIVSTTDAADGGGSLFALPDMGRDVPAPAFNADDFMPVSASGNVLARLPRSMHMPLTARAKSEGVSPPWVGAGLYHGRLGQAKHHARLSPYGCSDQ